jgi:hypothetical protein
LEITLAPAARESRVVADIFSGAFVRVAGGGGTTGAVVFAVFTVATGTPAGTDCDCCNAGVATATGLSAASTFGEPDLDQAIANKAAAASAPPPAKASVLALFRECVFDISIALATEALNETDAGYEGPLNFERTFVSSLAISSALV